MKNGALSAAVAVSLAAFLVLPAHARADSQTAALVKKVKPAVVQVITYDASGKAAKLGTGFFINAAGDVITCRHVMEGAVGANVRTSGGVDYPVAGIVAEDVDGDMVRLSISGAKASLPFLPLAANEPSEGDPILVIGNPAPSGVPLGWTVSDGIVSAVRPIPGFGAMVQITAPISQGSSGSPVVNMRGQVVGIVDFNFAEGQNLNFAMPVSRIAELKGKSAVSLRNRSSSGVGASQKAAQEEVKQGLNDISAGDYDAALNHFLNALKDNPNDGLAWGSAGYCWGMKENSEMAAKCYEKAISIVPEDAQLHSNLGAAYGDLGRYEDEVRECKQAIRLSPDLVEPHNNLGNAYINLGRYDEAVQEYKEAIRLKPDLVEPHCGLGGAYCNLGQYQEAVEEYKEAVRIRPDYAEAHNNLGVAYYNLARYQEAAEEYKEAIRLKPDLAQAHYGLSLAYGNLGWYDDQIRELKETIRLMPGYAPAHYGLGLTCLMLGDRSAALDEYNILKNLDASLADKLFNLIYP